MNRPINVTPAQQAAALAAFLGTSLPLPNAVTALAGSTGKAADAGHVHPLNYMPQVTIVSRGGSFSTTSTSEVIITPVYSLGTIGPQDYVYIEIGGVFISSSTAKSIYTRIGTSSIGATAGSNIVLSNSTSNATIVDFDGAGSLRCLGANNSQRNINWNAALGNHISSSKKAYDWSQPQYIWATGFDAAGNPVTLDHFYVFIQRGGA